MSPEITALVQMIIQVLIPVFMIAVTALVAMLVKAVKAKDAELQANLTAIQYGVLRTIVQAAVQFAQQTIEGETDAIKEERRAAVIKAVQDFLDKQGWTNLNANEIIIELESAILKGVQNGEG